MLVQIIEGLEFCSVQKFPIYPATKKDNKKTKPNPRKITMDQINEGWPQVLSLKVRAIAAAKSPHVIKKAKLAKTPKKIAENETAFSLLSLIIFASRYEYYPNGNLRQHQNILACGEGIKTNLIFTENQSSKPLLASFRALGQSTKI